MKTDIIWPESILKATPEALQRIADSKLVARNLRDIFPHPYTLDDAVAFLDTRQLFAILVGLIPLSGCDTETCGAYQPCPSDAYTYPNRAFAPFIRAWE